MATNTGATVLTLKTIVVLLLVLTCLQQMQLLTLYIEFEGYRLRLLSWFLKTCVEFHAALVVFSSYQRRNATYKYSNNHSAFVILMRTAWFKEHIVMYLTEIILN